MELQIIKPRGNPFKFTKMNYANIPQYISKFMDNFLFSDTIMDYEQEVSYCNPVLLTDAIRNQFFANFAPIFLKIYQSDGNFVFSQELEPLLPDLDRAGFYLYNMDFDPSILSKGCYYMTMDLGGGQLIEVSEPFDVLTNGANTQLLEYDNLTPRAGLIFYYSDGTKLFSPSLRVYSRLKYLGSESEDTEYIDQLQNATVIKSIEYDTHTFILGRSEGIPPYVMKRVARIFGMENVRIDGLYVSKIAQGQKFERIEEPDYPLQGWKLQVREKFAHDSDTTTIDGVITGMNSMMAVVEAKGFGMNDQGGNFLEIIKTV